MCQFFVHTEHIAYLTATDTDITGRNILVGTDVTVEFRHESLAEAHDLSIALTTGREVGATLGTTHRQCGQGVLEGLLKGEELQDGEVHRSVETDTALIRADGVVMLDTVAHVCLDLSLVIHPCDTEGDDAVGDAETLDEVVLLKFGMLIVDILDGAEDLTDGLDVLRLVGESALEILYDFCCFH